MCQGINKPRFAFRYQFISFCDGIQQRGANIIYGEFELYPSSRTRTLSFSHVVDQTHTHTHTYKRIPLEFQRDITISLMLANYATHHHGDLARASIS